ncbi:hypothetical protein KAR91_69805 [Candidatus Pacearchaeota archaeon]|nr:hypothetical protein [Candidatus Pacearchaeota archaeon]
MNDRELHSELEDRGRKIFRLEAENKKLNTRTPELPDPCTVEQYEEITGKTFPGMGLVWFWNRMNYWSAVQYRNITADDDNLRLEAPIVQTGKPAPNEGRRE